MKYFAFNETTLHTQKSWEKLVVPDEQPSSVVVVLCFGDDFEMEN